MNNKESQSEGRVDRGAAEEPTIFNIENHDIEKLRYKDSSEPVITTEQALQHLRRMMDEDHGYEIGWIANIAMAFKDNLSWYMNSNKKDIKDLDWKDIDVVANMSAVYFLNLLFKDKKDGFAA